MAKTKRRVIKDKNLDGYQRRPRVSNTQRRKEKRTRQVLRSGAPDAIMDMYEDDI